MMAYLTLLEHLDDPKAAGRIRKEQEELFKETRRNMEKTREPEVRELARSQATYPCNETN